MKKKNYIFKRRNLILILLSFLLASGIGFTPALAEQNSAESEDSQFKVVGYYSGDLFNEPVENLQTDKLTHVIYAFLIPCADGSLVPLAKPDQLRELVAQAHQDGAKVLIALGGWSYQGKPLVTEFETLAASDETRALLINNVCALLKEYDLDGLELDWEHPNQNSIQNYEKLVVEFKKALDQDKKELTAALNGAWSTTAGPEVSKLITDACLTSFSFINVMAYDMNNAEHSPLWFADTSINYWLERGVSAEKIILGMPLYARPSWMQYRHLADENLEYAYLDYVPTTPLESYYNGLNTLREKTLIALRKAGGIMLFDVNEDAAGEASVLSMIDLLKSRTKGYSREDLKRHITVVLNHRELAFLKDEGLGMPFIDVNNRIMLPLRKPMEAIGAKVSYEDVSKTVTAVYDAITVQVTVGDNRIAVNGQIEHMDTAAVNMEGRVYIPLRAVFTAFGYDLEWHSVSKTAYVTQKSIPEIAFWKKEVVSDLPGSTKIRYYTAAADGSEKTLLELNNMSEEHDLDNDGNMEIVVYQQGEKINIGVYDLISNELKYIDISKVLGSAWSDYTGNIGNIKSEYTNCIQAGFIDEADAPDRIEIYRYDGGTLVYLCPLSEALLK